MEWTNAAYTGQTCDTRAKWWSGQFWHNCLTKERGGSTPSPNYPGTQVEWSAGGTKFEVSMLETTEDSSFCTGYFDYECEYLENRNQAKQWFAAVHDVKTCEEHGNWWKEVSRNQCFTPNGKTPGMSYDSVNDAFTIFACADVPNCEGGLSCDRPDTSQCGTCTDGFYGDNCQECTTECDEGTYLQGTCSQTNNPICETCTTVADCQDGMYLEGACGELVPDFKNPGRARDGNPTCMQCTAITNCEVGGVTCTTDQDQTCGRCESGYFGSGCTACTLIPGCDKVLCSTDADQVCDGGCSSGYMPRTCSTPPAALADNVARNVWDW